MTEEVTLLLGGALGGDDRPVERHPEYAALRAGVERAEVAREDERRVDHVVRRGRHAEAAELGRVVVARLERLVGEKADAAAVGTQGVSLCRKADYLDLLRDVCARTTAPVVARPQTRNP